MDSPGVLKEIDCYISNNLRKQLLLLMYKNRERSRNLEFEDIKDGRIKQSLDLLELNVKDGRSPEITNIGEQSDSYLLRSNLMKLPTSLVGYFWNDECHFIPIEHDVLVVDTAKEQIRDKPRVTERSTTEGGHSSSAEKASGVVVSARLKSANNGMFGGKMGGGRRKPVDNDPDILFHNQQKQSPWRTVRYKQFSPDRAFENRIPLLYPYEDSDFADCHVYGTSQKNYTHSLLTQLSPTAANQSLTQPAVPSSTEELVRSIMLKAQVIRFNKLVTCVQDRSPDPHQVTNSSVLHSVQKFAVLVQGWWIVKSDLLYPPGTFSEHSGVSNNLLVRARDYIMAVFYRGEHLTRKTISSMTKLPALEATEILKTLTQRMDFKQRGHVNHWLFHPVDQEFVRRHPDIVQQQSTMWEARIRQLCTQLKLERLVSDGTRRKRVRSGRLYSESGSEPEPTTSTEPASLVSGFQVAGVGSASRRPLPRRRQLSLSQSPDAGSGDSVRQQQPGSPTSTPNPAKRARTHSLCLPDAIRLMSPPPLARADSIRSSLLSARRSRPTSPTGIVSRSVASELSASTALPPDSQIKLEPMSPPNRNTPSPVTTIDDSKETVAAASGELPSKATVSVTHHLADSHQTVSKEMPADEGKVESKAVNFYLHRFVQDQLRGRPLVSLSGLARLYQQTLSHGEECATRQSEGSLPRQAMSPPPPGSEAERELLKGDILAVLEQVDARRLSLVWPSIPSSLPEEPIFTSRVAGSECGAVCERTQKLRDVILELIEDMGSFRMGDLQDQLQKNSIAALPRKTIVSMLKHMCIYRRSRYFLRLTISE